MLPLPDRILFSAEPTELLLGTRSADSWSHDGTTVSLKSENEILAVEIHAPAIAPSRIILRWDTPLAAGSQFLGDAWERGYGELAWRSFVPERIMPWYFLQHDATSTTGYGVRTGPAAFCFWTADPRGISLWLDLRNGTEAVRLNDRTLRAAEIVSAHFTDRPFVAAQKFCRMMCPAPRLFPEPIYGGNDWYYSYGYSTQETILRDSTLTSSLADCASNRPFFVIDDGWQVQGCSNGAPWPSPHPNFPDMARLAREIRDTGCRPGLWLRLLLTHEKFPESWALPSRDGIPQKGIVLDPSIPEVLEKIRADLRTMTGWGYEMIKHDFTTFDLLSKWGFDMSAEYTKGRWKFHDDTRTNAEIISAFYRAIREGCGNAVVLGCNTISHLSAGLFEVQRTGDDVSGRGWERTRRMGLNTLAFRMPQHETFFAADADCLGLTNRVPWELNRQWLDLLAQSGTALFVSAAPDALGPEQRAAIRDAYAHAAKPQPAAEPLDWLNNTCPEHWQIRGTKKSYTWTNPDIPSPFMTG